MQIGICGGPAWLESAKELGFAYLEMSVSSIAKMSDEEFAALEKKVREVGLPTPTFNILFPGNVVLMGEKRDYPALRAYLQKAFGRISRLGAKKVVFGSGKARRRPEGVSYTEGWRDLVESTKIIGEEAAKFNIIIVIEPLRREECNMINSMAEGASLQADVNMPNVQLLTDFYHVATDNEPLADINRIGCFAHTHIASRYQRKFPMPGQPDDYKQFFARLKSIGYDERVSVEGNCDDLMAEGKVSLAYLKKLWDEADPAAL